ncbi:MAG: anti-sigma factor [Acetobacteraceae bacterium]
MTDPNHAVSEEDLHAYVDGRLDPERRAVMDAYLRTAPEMAGQVADDIAQREELRAALAAPAAEPLPPSLNLARLVEEKLRRRRFPWQAVAAAVVALFVGTACGWFLQARPSLGVDALAQEAGASYAVFAADPRRSVELGADQKDLLTRWISHRLNRPVAPPDLSADGYRLLGGRLVAAPHGAAALFVYENERGVRLIVYVRPMKTPDTTPIEQVDAPNVDGCAWIDHGVGYTVMAEESYGRLLRLSNQVRRQAHASY